ncbi:MULTISPECIES: ABC transporter ATP-binding protein [Bacillaceae]|uniref:ABC transporter ATP-binding protein n=1 Tax=Bacillaceae TaxID=186817 RepID=UPI0030E9324E
MNQYIIETNKLSKKFGNFIAVDNINLKVPKGEIYGFLGPNGAGKSTTIRMLLGLVRPTNGNVTIFGKPMKECRLEILTNIGSMVEYPSYYGHLTAYENLDLARRILEIDQKEIDRVLEIVKLTDVKNKVVKKFSLGMKQRLGIAQALLGNPELLILDEPTNGLDPSGINEIRDLIRSLPKIQGVTVFVSSHILNEIELIASHVGIMKKGKLIFQGTIDELKGKSRTEIRMDVRPAEAALKQLTTKGYTVYQKNGLLNIQDKGINPAHINRELVLNGYDVYQISSQHDTIEDIFLHLTDEKE